MTYLENMYTGWRELSGGGKRGIKIVMESKKIEKEGEEARLKPQDFTCE